MKFEDSRSDFELLKELADDGKIELRPETDSDIVMVWFDINGVRVVAQFDSDSIGIYGVEVGNVECLYQMIKGD